MTNKIEKLPQSRVGKLHDTIGNIQCLLNYIGKSGIGDENTCPFCLTKIDVNELKKKYNEFQKEANSLDSNTKYLNIED